MSKKDLVHADMIAAMKNKDKVTKGTLSMLLAALKNAEIDKRSPLTESEENAVIQKEIKQTKETLESAPQNREDIITECINRLKILEKYAPKMLTEEEINDVIQNVIMELSITSPSKKDKGRIMKILMPKVKGLADGSLVNSLLEAKLS